MSSKNQTLPTNNNNNNFISPPPKNKKEKQDWDRMSVKMESFHSYFRNTFQSIWENSDKLELHSISLKSYLKTCEELNSHLSMHHAIEEQHIFPILAQKMSIFADNNEHKQQHKLIHSGLDRYMAYITKVKANPTLYNANDFKKILASWGPDLMHHLDAEVETLRGDNLRKYYTLEEVRALPM